LDAEDEFTTADENEGEEGVGEAPSSGPPALSRAGWHASPSAATVTALDEGGSSPEEVSGELLQALERIAALQRRIVELEQELSDPLALRRRLAAIEVRRAAPSAGETGGLPARVTVARPRRVRTAEEEALEKADVANLVASIVGSDGAVPGAEGEEGDFPIETAPVVDSSSGARGSGIGSSSSSSSIVGSSVGNPTLASEKEVSVHKVTLLEDEDARESHGSGGGGDEGPASLQREPVTATPSSRTLDIWQTFFENAARFRAGGGEASGGSAIGGGEGSSGGGSGGSPFAASLSLLQAVAVGDLAAVERLMLLGVPCTSVITSPAPLHPYPVLRLDSAGRLLITLKPSTGLRISPLHMACATGNLGALEPLGDSALMERESGDPGLEVCDGQGAWPLLISCALALYYCAAQPPSKEAAAAAQAHISCAVHLLGSAADCSFSKCNGAGVGLRHVHEGLLQLSQYGLEVQESAELAAMLSEYGLGLG